MPRRFRDGETITYAKPGSSEKIPVVIVDASEQYSKQALKVREPDGYEGWISLLDVRQKPEYGLFVHRGDGRYRWADKLGGKSYLRESAAQKAADSMNARGEHDGNVVVRSRGYTSENPPVSRRKAQQILREGTAHGKPLTEKQRKMFGARASGYPVRRQKKRTARGRTRKNPARSPQGRHGRLIGQHIDVRVAMDGGFVNQMKYEDASDRRNYVHDFKDYQALMYLVKHPTFGNAILVVSTDDKPLWEDA